MNQHWKNVLIGPDQSIREALTLINDESLRIALIVDEEMKLLGTVTDGDIRRGLLKNLSLETCVSKVMNKSPLTATSMMPKADLIDLMNLKDILAIPLIEGEKVIGLETLHGVMTEAKFQNPVFLMAGGFGTRLRPLTDTCPKPMLKIGDRPILETVLLCFIKSGFENFYISTHYMASQISDYFGNGEKWGVNITYIHEETPLGTGGALGLLPKDIPDFPIILMNSDILTTVDFRRLLEFHEANEADATMCVREYDYQIPYGVIEGEGNKILSMVEKPVQHFFVNAGIYVLSNDIVKSVSSNFVIDMPTLLEQRIEQKDEVLMFPIHEYWLDIGRMDDFKRAQTDIKALGLV